MRRFGFGLLAAGLIAAATLLTTYPASAGHGGGMIFIPPMGGLGGIGGMGGPGLGGPGMHGPAIGGPGMGGLGNNWRGPGMGGFGGPNGGWHGPGSRFPFAGNNYHGGQPFHGNWHGNGWNGNGWNGNGWNGNGWHGNGWHGNGWHGNGWHGNGWHGNGWHGNGYWHGPRYSYRYPGYNFFYGGFWYPWPWWQQYGGGWDSEIGDNYGYYGGGGYSSAHVQYCMNRYRSYNPNTDTYTGYDGRRHRCLGP